jgi:osmotically inducible protein OsmC
MKRSANAKWEGDLLTGKGTISTESHVLNGSPYSFQTRFEEHPGTNPEELLAAAHAGCFTMALSNQLKQKGLTAEKLATKCSITLGKDESGFSITESHLELQAVVPGASQEAFDAAVSEAEMGCPVSKLYKTRITVTSSLDS